MSDVPGGWEKEENGAPPTAHRKDETSATVHRSARPDGSAEGTRRSPLNDKSEKNGGSQMRTELAISTPRAVITWVSDSRAEDASPLAMADVASTPTYEQYRLIGGNMVSCYARLYPEVAVVPRGTGDAAAGIPATIEAATAYVNHLLALGYERQGGNRYVRQDVSLELVVDLLVADVGMDEHNIEIGDGSYDSAPALSIALARSPHSIHVDATLTDGRTVSTDIALPDLATATAMKLLSYGKRWSTNDSADSETMLRICAVAGVTCADLSASIRKRSGPLVRSHFAKKSYSTDTQVAARKFIATYPDL